MLFTHAFITIWQSEGTLVLERDHGEPIAVLKLKEKGVRFRGDTHKREIVATEHDFKIPTEKQEILSELKNVVVCKDHGSSYDEPGVYPVSDARFAEIQELLKGAELIGKNCSTVAIPSPGSGYPTSKSRGKN